MNILALLAITSSISSGWAANGPADRLLSQVERTTRALKSFKIDVDSVDTWTFAESSKRPPRKSSSTVELVFERPNRFVGNERESNFPGPFETLSDGKSLFYVHNKTYEKGSINPEALQFHWYHNDLLLFYVTGSLKKAIDPPYPPETQLLPEEDFDGGHYRVIGIHVGGGVPINYKLYVGKDLLVHRVTHLEKDDARTFEIDATAKQVSPNPEVAPDTFSLHASQGLTETPAPNYYKDNPLIAAGATATDFSLPSPDGGRLALRSEMAGKKAFLLNFWFVGCPPCRAEHPKLQKLFSELNGKGLGMIAIDDQDTPARVAKYLADAHLSFPTVLTGPMAAIDPKTGYPNYRGPKLPDYASLVPYGVHECPTNVLLDKDFKVVYVATEWNEKALRAKLKELGVE